MAEKISDFDYPRWKYHAIHKPVIVNSAREEKMLGSGWENSPAYFEKKKGAEVHTSATDKVEQKKSIKEKMWQLLGI